MRERVGVGQIIISRDAVESLCDMREERAPMRPKPLMPQFAIIKYFSVFTISAKVGIGERRK